MNRKEQAEATIDTLATRVHKLRMTAQAWQETADLMKDREREALAALDTANRQVAELRLQLDTRNKELASCGEAAKDLRSSYDRVCTELRTVKAWLETRTKERDQQHQAAQDWETKWRILNGECLTLRANVEPMQKALQTMQAERDEERTRAEGLRCDYQLLRADRDSLKQSLRAEPDHPDELTALSAERGSLKREVESLRAKLNAKTIEWPEWAKVGARVRVRSTRNAVTQRNFAEGEEFVIEKVYYTDWAVRSPRQYWAHLSDLEPVAEHVAQPVVVATQSATQTPEETAPVVSPKVGDKVRLIKRPSTADYDGRQWDYTWGETGEIAVVNYVGLCVNVIRANGLKNDWPLSCVEVVK